MGDKDYLVCCSVFKDEVENLSLNKDFVVVFLGMTLHSDYSLLEKNLRTVLENCVKKNPGKIVLVYGDDCLGLNGEMKKLAKEFDAVKVDAVNCIDCFLGGKGNYLKADPEQKLIFLTPGWIKYFNHQQKKATEEEKSFLKTMFIGFRGIVLLDTTGNLSQYKDQINNFMDFTGLKILETKKLDSNQIKQLINQTIQKNN
ncbi:MAG: DUF1638 domain-containing protein [Candidatus Bathyarchaeota archaeon]|nr:DUF1638 domain-containing protein [Candidatus Bathyarchaeota archaeon]